MTKRSTCPLRSALGGTLLILGLLGLAAPAPAESEPGGCGHAHAAPHGGTLIPLGDHIAHAELLLDPETGSVRLYVLSAHAENALRVEDRSLTIALESRDGNEVETGTLTLRAVANPLTGETVGDTSEFAGQLPQLVGARRFEGRLQSLHVRGIAFEDIVVGAQAISDPHDHSHEPFDPEDDDAY